MNTSERLISLEREIKRLKGEIKNVAQEEQCCVCNKNAISFPEERLCCVCFLLKMKQEIFDELAVLKQTMNTGGSTVKTSSSSKTLTFTSSSNIIPKISSIDEEVSGIKFDES